jgi:type II secretory pathway pseudopilin PulG
MIEIIFSIAIIVLLISLLVVAVSSARERSRQVQCLTQLHALGVAFEVYRANDSRHCIVPVESVFKNWPRILGQTVDFQSLYCPSADESERSIARSSYAVVTTHNGMLPRLFMSRFNQTVSQTALAGENREFSNLLVFPPDRVILESDFGWRRHRRGTCGGILWFDCHVSTSAEEGHERTIKAFMLGMPSSPP